LSVSAIIAQQREQLIERWVEGAHRVASTRGLGRPQLTNLMPAYLSTLGRSPSADSPTTEQRHLIEHHLSLRLRQGFELGEVLVEFSLLARIIGDTLNALPLSEKPPPDEVARLFQELHAASLIVSQIYSEHLFEDEQLEKRYARLIQDVVSEAVHAGEGGLPVRDY
jgi:hypothetical protein